MLNRYSSNIGFGYFELFWILTVLNRLRGWCYRTQNYHWTYKWSCCGWSGYAMLLLGSVVEDFCGHYCCWNTNVVQQVLYLAEYVKGLLLSITDFANDVLLSSPQLLIGLFIYCHQLQSLNSRSFIRGMGLVLRFQQYIFIPSCSQDDRQISYAKPNNFT